MNQSLGLIEVKGLVAAVLVADTMAKTANVTITQVENTRGLGWMTIKAQGDVGAVNAAVHSGKLMAESNNYLVSAKVIARPSDSVQKVFCGEEKPNKTSNKVAKVATNTSKKAESTKQTSTRSNKVTPKENEKSEVPEKKATKVEEKTPTTPKKTPTKSVEKNQTTEKTSTDKNATTKKEPIKNEAPKEKVGSHSSGSKQ
ncbi:microcompartment protein CcmL/EutN [Natranaerovirga hydrolytica]|uniref:Microcompartment protein CcmL/EutN n=1 Tax=Natranaerovirga hydrolytica TaxID=680378 RepID=A0A4R1MAQ5_9FIRM|nr:BMC domain-containing protein [Natranaerovirga hydrolytica]TCK88034.1 microcompartment protein CcmL/EutN [Natranaerovirga hydrolytica]